MHNYNFLASIAQLLEQMCLIPYTRDELTAFGFLGYDIDNSTEFAEIYFQKLQDKYHAMMKNQKVAFADLNVQIYSDILTSSAIEKLPDWLTLPDSLGKNSNPVKQKIIELYRKKLNISQKNSSN